MAVDDTGVWRPGTMIQLQECDCADIYFLGPAFQRPHQLVLLQGFESGQGDQRAKVAIHSPVDGKLQFRMCHEVCQAILAQREGGENVEQLSIALRPYQVPLGQSMAFVWAEVDNVQVHKP